MAAPVTADESGAVPDSSNEIGRRIFCNRALNMNQIKAVGFDLDYTLAEYIPETFDLLAYKGDTSPNHCVAHLPDRALAALTTESQRRERGLWCSQAPSGSCSRWGIRRKSQSSR